MIRYSAAARHDHQFLKEIKLPKGSYITFDKAYVDYAQYDEFTRTDVFYVTRLKSNAKYSLTLRYDVHPEEIVTIIEDADIEFEYTDKNVSIRARAS